MTNPYDQYIESSILTATPLELVTMLYRCALDSVAHARLCLQTGDIEGRARPVTRAFDALTELSMSLDHERGGDISRNLSELYAYMQRQLLLGHCNQSDENFAEVARLLGTLLESWVQVSKAEPVPASPPPAAVEHAYAGGGYLL